MLVAIIVSAETTRVDELFHMGNRLVKLNSLKS